ncbi:MAG: DsbA family protein, partial [Candidatus Binataceae bacterium]
ALISGIFAERGGRFREYSRVVFARFFARERDLESIDALAVLISEVGLDDSEFRRFVDGEGPAALADALAQGARDHVFGVPLLIVAGEPFWGNDRIPWIIKKLDAMGLRRLGLAILWTRGRLQ